MAGKQESLQDYFLMAKEIARQEKSLGIEHWDGIGIEQDKVKDGLYKAFRNGSCYNECIPEWEDLVRNGYAKRWGEIGQTIFYGVTQKGFEAIARRWGVRIRYEIEVG